MDVYGRTRIYSSAGPDGKWFSDDDVRTFKPICKYIFTSREYDADTGLYYYRARFYHPDLGRFLSRDPIGYSGGMNLYGYVGGNPLNAGDPSGNDANSDAAEAIFRGDSRSGGMAHAMAMRDRSWNIAQSFSGQIQHHGKQMTAADNNLASNANAWRQQSAMWDDYIHRSTPHIGAVAKHVMNIFGSEASFKESLWPVWGPFRAALLRFEEASDSRIGLGWRAWSSVEGAADVGLAASDLFFVRSLLRVPLKILERKGLISAHWLWGAGERSAPQWAINFLQQFKGPLVSGKILGQSYRIWEISSLLPKTGKAAGILRPTLRFLNLKNILRVEAHPTEAWLSWWFFNPHFHIDAISSIQKLHLPIA